MPKTRESVMKDLKDKSFAGYKAMDAMEARDASLAPKSMGNDHVKNFNTTLPSGGTGTYNDSVGWAEKIMSSDSAKAKSQRYNP